MGCIGFYYIESCLHTQGRHVRKTFSIIQQHHPYSLSLNKQLSIQSFSEEGLIAGKSHWIASDSINVPDKTVFMQQPQTDRKQNS